MTSVSKNLETNTKDLSNYTKEDLKKDNKKANLKYLGASTGALGAMLAADTLCIKSAASHGIGGQISALIDNAALEAELEELTKPKFIVKEYFDGTKHVIDKTPKPKSLVDNIKIGVIKGKKAINKYLTTPFKEGGFMSKVTKSLPKTEAGANKFIKIAGAITLGVVGIAGVALNKHKMENYEKVNNPQ